MAQIVWLTLRSISLPHERNGSGSCLAPGRQLACTLQETASPTWCSLEVRMRQAERQALCRAQLFKSCQLPDTACQLPPHAGTTGSRS